MKNIYYSIALVCLMFMMASFSYPYEPEYAVCTNITNYPLLKAAGYQYVESNVPYLMPDRSDAEFQEHLDEIKRVEARIISCTSFIPGSLPLVGPDAKQDEALVWADSALRRAGMVNIPYIVFGSGDARNVPEGFDREEAARQFISFCKQVAPLAQKYKVTVVIEPLNRSETNLVNSLEEGARIVEAVGHPNLQLLCDIYHMMREDEPASEIVKYGKYIRHCHIAEREERTSPGTKGDDFRLYFRALKEIGYKGCVSIEGRWKDLPREIQPALSYMQEQFRDRPVLKIGDRRQLFVDQMFIQEENNVRLQLHTPIKTGDTCIFSGTGLPSVIEKDGIYHMWYSSSSISYARSYDGIHWECPSFNLTADSITSKPNNTVLGHGAGGVKGNTHGGMVFIDPNAPEDECYKLVVNPDEFSSFIQVFSSPDGIHWKHTHRDLITYDTRGKTHHLDTRNGIFWDSRINKYVAYIRKNVPESSDEGWTQGRSVARGESGTLADFGDANDLPVVMRAGGREDIYTFSAVKYPWAENVYLAFPTLYYHYDKWHSDFSEETPTNAGVLDARFAVSRDGINWNNFKWEPFVPLGMNGEFDSKRIYMGYGIVPALNGREMYMYYWGFNSTHGWNRDERNNRLLTAANVEPKMKERAIISRVVLRRDGFVSVHAPYEGGNFTTPLLRFRGNQLILNIENASTGEVRVEIRDENGKPIQGFSLDDCDLIHTANEINRPVTWNGKSDIRELEDKTIQLHFSMRDTDLYAFQFRYRPAF